MVKTPISRPTINNNNIISRTKQNSNSQINNVSNNFLLKLIEITSDILNYTGKKSEYNSDLYKTSLEEAKSLKKLELATQDKIFIDIIELITLYKRSYIILDINNDVLDHIDEKYVKLKVEFDILQNKLNNSNLIFSMSKIENFLYLQASVDERIAWYKFLKHINSNFDSINSTLHFMTSFDDSKNTLLKFIKYL